MAHATWAATAIMTASLGATAEFGMLTQQSASLATATKATGIGNALRMATAVPTDAHRTWMAPSRAPQRRAGPGSLDKYKHRRTNQCLV